MSACAMEIFPLAFKKKRKEKKAINASMPKASGGIHKVGSAGTPINVEVLRSLGRTTGLNSSRASIQLLQCSTSGISAFAGGGTGVESKAFTTRTSASDPEPRPAQTSPVQQDVGYAVCVSSAPVVLEL